MSGWFHELSCPTCGRSQRYTPNTVRSTITCSGCNQGFIPSEVIGATHATRRTSREVAGDESMDPDTAQFSKKSRRDKVPEWAAEAPAVLELTRESIELMSDGVENAASIWSGEDAHGGDPPRVIHGSGIARFDPRTRRRWGTMMWMVVVALCIIVIILIIGIGVVAWNFWSPTANPVTASTGELPNHESTPESSRKEVDRSRNIAPGLKYPQLSAHL